MSHLYEMTRRNFFNEKARSEMPTELDVNKIAIPRKNCKEEWVEKLKKYQKSAVRYRQEYELIRTNQKQASRGGKERGYVKREGRTKTDAKALQQETTRN